MRSIVDLNRKVNGSNSLNERKNEWHLISAAKSEWQRAHIPLINNVRSSSDLMLSYAQNRSSTTSTLRWDAFSGFAPGFSNDLRTFEILDFTRSLRHFTWLGPRPFVCLNISRSPESSKIGCMKIMLWQQKRKWQESESAMLPHPVTSYAINT